MLSSWKVYHQKNLIAWSVIATVKLEYSAIAFIMKNAKKNCIIYEAQCRICKSSYVGNSQQFLKSRMNKHYNDVQQCVLNGIATDTFAEHFARYFVEKPKSQQLCEMIKYKILWQGNPLSLSKTFGKSCCSLCIKERLIILDRLRRDPSNLINKNSEIYGSCRHKPCFHRFTSSTEDARNAERASICTSLLSNSTCTSMSNNSSTIYRTKKATKIENISICILINS